MWSPVCGVGRNVRDGRRWRSIGSEGFVAFDLHELVDAPLVATALEVGGHEHGEDLLGKPDADHYLDAANYIALMGEAALSVVNEQLTTAETAHAELQDLLAQRAAQLGPVVTVRPCKACDGTGNCAINRDRYNTPCPACNGTGHRQFMEAACSAT